MEQSKFEIGQLWPLALTVGIVAVGTSVLLQVQGEIADDLGEDDCNTSQTYNETGNVCYPSSGWGTTDNTTTTPATAGYNASLDGIDAVAKFPAKLGIIVSVIVLAVIIGVLVRYLSGR